MAIQLVLDYIFKGNTNKKYKYKRKQFTKYSTYKGDTYVYDSFSNQWLIWYIISDEVEGGISEHDMILKLPHDIMEDKTYNQDDLIGQEQDCAVAVRSEDSSRADYENCTSDDSYSGNNTVISSYSNSSNDSCSSSSFSSGDGGGGCF